MPLYYPPTQIGAGSQTSGNQTIVLSNSNGVSFGMSNSSIVTASVSGLVQWSSYDAYRDSPLVAGQQGQATLHVQPYPMPTVQFDRVVLPIIWSNTSNSSNSQTLSLWVGVYTKNASTLSLVSSTSMSTNFTASGTAGSYSLYGGARLLTVGWTGTLQASEYYLGIVSRTTTGGGAGATLSQFCISQANSNFSGILGAASAATAQLTLGLGVYTVSTAGMPSSIGLTQLNGSASMALRAPAIYFNSGTA